MGIEGDCQKPRAINTEEWGLKEGIKKIACGHNFTVFLTESGKLYGMGRNNFYQIGLPDLNSQKRPQIVESLQDLTFVDVACGYDHTIALTDDGKVYSMGRNTHFQLGNSKTTSQQPHVIQALENFKIKSIACGSNFTMVLSSDGKVYGFGQNSNGQLGFRDLNNQFNPRLLLSMNRPVNQIACGAAHSMFLVDGMLYALGSDQYGQLGLGEQTNGQDFLQVTIVMNLAHIRIRKVCCGSYYTAVITEDDRVFTFGQNNYGQLAQGHTTNIWIPNEVILDDVIDIEAGMYHCVFLTDDGKLYGAGQGTYLQNGSLASVNEPFEILALSGKKFNRMAMGNCHGFAYYAPSTKLDLIPPSDFISQIEATLNQSQHSDVTFIVEGKHIYANKFVLGLRCEKFRRQFAAQMRDSIENAFIISDVSYNHYLSFLKYLYSDKTEFSSEDAIEILKLADQHGLDRLKRICEKKIKRGIDIDNAAYVYLLATMYNTQTLRRYCLSFMIQPENFDAIIKTDAFANLDKESILDVLKARPVSTTQLLRRT
jgi:RCC1 and BTB domain-containing protein